MVLVYWSKDNSSRKNSVFCALHGLRKTALCHQQNVFFCFFVFQFEEKSTYLISKSLLTLGHRFVTVSSVKGINLIFAQNLFWLEACLMLGTFASFLSRPRDTIYKATSAYSTPSPPPSCHSQQY